MHDNYCITELDKMPRLKEKTVEQLMNDHYDRYKPYFDQALKELNPDDIPLLQLETVSIMDINKLAEKLMKQGEKKIIQKIKKEEKDNGKNIEKQNWNRHPDDDIPF